MKKMELQNFMKNTEPVAQWLTGLSKEDNKTYKKAIMIINMEIESGLEESATDEDRTDAWSAIRSNGKRMIRAEVKNAAGDTFPPSESRARRQIPSKQKFDNFVHHFYEDCFTCSPY